MDTNFQHGNKLDYMTVDRDGVRPNLTLIGSKYRHSGNGKRYVLEGYCWNGETDQWNMVMIAVQEDLGQPVPVVRPIEHLTGFRDNGARRYEAII